MSYQPVEAAVQSRTAGLVIVSVAHAVVKGYQELEVKRSVCASECKCLSLCRSLSLSLSLSRSGLCVTLARQVADVGRRGAQRRIRGPLAADLPDI